ncbi:uncharacterized protein BT62DRAFT_62483 [Guyanagaster necrorhizus]|uniref:Uncharacterized protein n=1 Tax=Guyanagaster necrorhizus TaxID=856835 RepID=A0A9P8AUP0_9AGAR|nr:uncharacterized protein BT62DRAFT_62483 [Guyanagaster necrorhizus MCA 3950]KAG7447112.1 hypothetical protein BT62DRAFT_62483 [Guyanagaster necrorhizus MCA 3950]
MYTNNVLELGQLYEAMTQLFDSSILCSAGDTGGKQKRSTLKSADPVASFAIDGLNGLFEVFAIRYLLEPTPQEDATYQSFRVSHPVVVDQLPAGQYRMKEEKLNSPTWLYYTLRAHAKNMKVPKEEGICDWCRNACYSQDVLLGSSRKRGSTMDRLNTKRWKGMCADMCSLQYKTVEDEVVEKKDSE